MHTVLPSFKPEFGEEVIGWTVVFVETNRVGDIVASNPRFVRQYETSEWDFIQAVNLCNQLNGGNSDAMRDVANHIEELRNSFIEVWDFVKDLIEKERDNARG